MYKNILFPVDVSEENSCTIALPAVLDLVRGSGATLHVLSVLPDTGMSLVVQYFPEGAAEAMMEEAGKTLDRFTQQHFPKDMEIRRIVTQGSVYRCIVDAAERIGADLIVMAAHKPGLQDYLLGPNAAKVVRHSRCSVMVVREKSPRV